MVSGGLRNAAQDWGANRLRQLERKNTATAPVSDV